MGGDLDIGGSKIKSLFFCPEKVGGNFYCEETYITSLIGGSVAVGNNYYCGNTLIKNLVGVAKEIGLIFSLNESVLKSLVEVPDKVGYYICTINNLNGERFKVIEIDMLVHMRSKQEIERNKILLEKNIKNNNKINSKFKI